MKEIIAQIKELWSKMDKTRRAITVAVLVAVLVILILAIVWAGSPRYEQLYARLSEQDRSAVITKLEEMNVPYRATASGGIEVPNAVSVRANLLKEGIPSGGVVGWEIFDQTSFSTTDFSNEINRQRAIAGELTRTLQRVDGIIDAKILLNLPDSSQYLFADEKPDGTASIQLQLRSPNVLGQSQVEAIVNMAAAGIGIKPENITVIDNYANDLTALLRSKIGTRAGAANLSDRFHAKIEYEDLTRKSIESMLTKVFGFNKSVVRVDADLDLDYREIKSETYGKSGVPRSEQERNETYEGTGGGAYGIAGTDSNINTYQVDGAGSGGSVKSEKTERTVNYEIDKTEEFRIPAPGKVNRLSVGVWINGDLPQATKEKVINTVMRAAGLNEERGDVLTVENINFAEPEQFSNANQLELSWQTILLAIGAVLLLFVVFLVVKKILSGGKRTRRSDLDDGFNLGSQMDTIIDDNGQVEQAAMMELSTEEKMRIERINQLEKLALEHPDEVAALLQSWLSED